MTIYKDLRLKREERKASWGISWGIYIPSPWVILLSAIWRSPVIPLSYFHRDLPSLISIGTFHLFSIIRNLPSLSGNILQFPDTTPSSLPLFSFEIIFDLRLLWMYTVVFLNSIWTVLEVCPWLPRRARIPLVPWP